MQKVKVLTVLICSKNGAPYIARCLDSLSKQTLDKSLWSILFVNHRSTDNSLEILNRIIAHDEGSEFPLPKIEILNLPEPIGGLAYAKNMGLRKITTPYVAFQDIDDKSMPQRLEIQLKIMQDGVRSMNSDESFAPYMTDICATQAWDLYQDGRLMTNCFEIGQYQFDRDIKERLPKENVLCHGSIMARKYVFEAAGGYNERDYALGQEDWLLWQRLASAGYKFYNVPERLYCYSMGTSVER